MAVEEAVTVGDPTSADIQVGPVVSKIQFERVEDYIAKGIAEGAKLLIGGAGRPAGRSSGPANCGRSGTRWG